MNHSRVSPSKRAGYYTGSNKRQRGRSRSRSRPRPRPRSQSQPRYAGSYKDPSEMLLDAIEDGNQRSIPDLLKRVKDIPIVNEALLHACKTGACLGIVKLIIEFPGVNVQHKDLRDWGALHFLCHHYNGPDFEPILKMLQDHGASINVQNDKGATPLQLAVGKGQKELVSLLIDYGADIEVADWEGMRPLHFAIYRGWKDIAYLLMEAKANVNAQDRYGYTPLHFAGKKTETPIAITEELIKKGARVDMRNEKGETPIDVGRKFENALFLQAIEKKQVESIPSPSSQVSVSETKPVATVSMPSISPEKCCSVVNRLDKVAFELGVENDRSRGAVHRVKELEEKIYEKSNTGRIADRLRAMEYELGIID